MKKGMIIATILATLMLVGAARAQHVKVIDGTRLGTVSMNADGRWIELSSYSYSGSSVAAGRTIRLRIAAANNRGKLIVGTDSTRTVDSTNSQNYFTNDYSLTVSGMQMTRVPCQTRAQPTSDDSPTIDVTFIFAPADRTVSVATDPKWKNTCQVLTMQLRNGEEFKTKLRFR